MKNSLIILKQIIFYLLFLLTILLAERVCLANDVPAWLSGKPNLYIMKERNMLYEWVFRQADEQTNGYASKEILAKQRLINLSNKLVAYSERTDKKEFTAKLIYLVTGAGYPVHFKFFITSKKLKQLLHKIIA